MYTRFLYGILAILSVSMLLFVAGFLCIQLGMISSASLFYSVAAKIMLLAMGLMFLLGCSALAASFYSELRCFFRREAVSLRQVWWVRAQKLHLVQRVAQEFRQIDYLNQLKYQRLLAADNKKHLRALYSAIYQELQAVRSEMPNAGYRTLCKDLRRHHKQADGNAMLTLRQKIQCR